MPHLCHIKVDDKKMKYMEKDSSRDSVDFLTAISVSPTSGAAMSMFRGSTYMVGPCILAM